jgi:hypothetical protein
MKVIILAVVVAMFAALAYGGSVIRAERGPDYDFENLTSKLAWEPVPYDVDSGFQKSVSAFMDFLGISTMEFAKFSMRYGFDNPSSRWTDLAVLAKFTLYAIVAFLVLRSLIPLVVIGYIGALLLKKGWQKYIQFMRKVWPG